jgi:hypothetical protein
MTKFSEVKTSCSKGVLVKYPRIGYDEIDGGDKSDSGVEVIELDETCESWLDPRRLKFNVAAAESIRIEI